MNRFATAFAAYFTSSTRLLAVAAVFVMAAGSAAAQSIDQIRAEFARQVYAHAGDQINHGQPQAMLRAVVVLRIKLDESGRWVAEVFRDNDTQPELTQVALQSVAKLPPPTQLKPEVAEALRSNGLIEAWLFEKDGRFALKTLAKPQKRA